MFALPLLPLIVFVVAAGFAVLGPSITRALAPGAGGLSGFLIKVTTAPLTLALQIGSKIGRVMGPVAAQPQQQVGAALDDAATLATTAADTLVYQSEVIGVLAQAIAGTATSADVAKQAGRLEKRVGNAEAQARGIGADVLPQVKAAAQGIEAGVNQRIGSLDKTLERVATQDIPSIRARARATDNELSKLWRWAHKNLAAVGTLTFAGAVAIALSKLGGGWIRCRNWNRIGREVCNTPLGDIESLLGLLAAGAVVADFRELVKLAQKVERGVAVGLQDIARL